MPLTEKIEFQSITILSDGQINVRKDRVIVDDLTGEELGRKPHRNVLEPDAFLADVPPQIRHICEAVWTPGVKAAYAEAKAKREAQFRATPPGGQV